MHTQRSDGSIDGDLSGRRVELLSFVSTSHRIVSVVIAADQEVLLEEWACRGGGGVEQYDAHDHRVRTTLIAFYYCITVRGRVLWSICPEHLSKCEMDRCSIETDVKETFIIF